MIGAELGADLGQALAWALWGVFGVVALIVFGRMLLRGLADWLYVPPDDGTEVLPDDD